MRSEVSAEAAGDLSYDAGAVTFSGGADVSFSTKTDIGVNIGLSHSFDIDSWSVSPTVLVNAGTQNFYEDYFANRKFVVKRKRRSGSTTPHISVIKKGFSVLDYEASLPVTYEAKKWGLFFTPTYSIPENPVKYSFNNGVTYNTETLSNSFYVELGAYVKF